MTFRRCLAIGWSRAYGCPSVLGTWIDTVLVIAIAAHVIAIATVLAGCDQLREQPQPPAAASPIPPVPQMPRDIPPGSKVTFTETYEGGNSTETVKGTGAGYTASGDKVGTDVDTTAPGATLSNGASGTGGASRGSLSAFTENKSTHLAVGIVGGLLAALGAWMFSRGNKHGLAIVAVGGGMVVAAMLPAWFLIVLACVGVAGCGYLIYTVHLAPSHSALRAVTAGVDQLPGGMLDTAKKLVGSHANEADKKRIKAVKRADELTN